jgi:hypothetical protein
MPHIDPEIQKQAVKEALREWIDERYAEVGKWTIRGLFALAFAGGVYLALVGLGYHR